MLRSLKVRNLRCFDAFECAFEPGLNLIVGPNARGKTSVLEAACILLRLASPRVSRLGHVVQHERRGFVVDGYFSERHMQFYFSRERKKLALDEVEQKSATEYLKLGRLVYFSNADIEIARGPGETRRRFLDFICVQRESGYRSALRDYERALRSRNLLLKAAQPRWREIAAFDEPLIASGKTLTAARARLVADLQPLAQTAHREISGARETLRMEYQAGAGADFASLLAHSHSEDARLRVTSVGPHRDEMQNFLNESAIDFASEGQQRTLVLALKISAAKLLAQHFATAPLLLLDDIFGELDLDRRNALLASLPVDSQKIVTTTHLDWLPRDAAAKVLRLGD